MKKLIISLVPDALMVLGAAGVSCGVGMIYAPAGIIVCGVLALAAGILSARAAGK